MVDRKKQDDKKVDLYVVLKVHKKKHLRRCVSLYLEQNIGDWSNGMTGVSKTLSGSSILSSPAEKNRRIFGGFFMSDFKTEHNIKYVLRINTLFYE